MEMDQNAIISGIDKANNNNPRIEETSAGSEAVSVYNHQQQKLAGEDLKANLQPTIQPSIKETEEIAAENLCPEEPVIPAADPPKVLSLKSTRTNLKTPESNNSRLPGKDRSR